MQWMFAVFSLNPSVKILSSVDIQQSDEINKRIASLFQRLLVVDCRSQTVDAIKNEGPNAIEAAFKVLGEIATRDLMSDKEVAKEIEGFIKYLDQSKFEEIGIK
jgi:hypothetical protein